MQEPFAGVWELDPFILDCQSGRPGRRAIYIIKPSDDGLVFHLEGEDADGNPIQFEYGGPRDGRELPVPGSERFPAPHLATS